MAKSSKRRKPKKTSGLYLSTMVIHRIKDTMELVSSVERLREMLAAGLAKRYLPRLLPGETPPDCDLAIDLAVRDLCAALNHLSEVDDQVSFARTDHPTGGTPTLETSNQRAHRWGTGFERSNRRLPLQTSLFA